MGTLSGGGNVVISVGERCLIGAEAGVGIALGDECVVEAGLYITAGTRVTMPDGQVYIRFGASETKIDLGQVTTDIAIAVRAFFNLNT